MNVRSVNEIREAYLKFFEERGHLRLPSFSLVPKNDPSILLINAGMTPMKAYFRGLETPPCKRVTTCQKCIRTPDIDQVGHTARHGTFFEMLGNFSFGDYFKAEIIPWAWTFSTEVLGLDPSRIYVTVYKDDDEAYKIWHEVVGLPEAQIERMGKEDNFWEHGTGPCGPCSELFYDRGEAYGCGDPNCGVACSCDRYIEYWNLVFTQFDRQEDGSYAALKKRNIDTGAGLERIACIVQGVDNLFEVDTVRALLDEVCRLAGRSYEADARDDVAIRVVTDHVRSSTMMISDGITPSNTGRGYVLRRLIRRAARFGRILGIEEAFLYKLAPLVIQASGEAYPNLKERESFILRVLRSEEEAFDKTIRQGQQVLDQYVAEARKEGRAQLDGEAAFRLHDTYGFPLDLTKEILAEEGLGLDEAGFRAAMERQREKGRLASRKLSATAWGGEALPEKLRQTAATVFEGYDTLETEAELLWILARSEDGEPFLTDEAVPGMNISLVFDRTVFYANSGGQVGDRGEIRAADAADADLQIRVDDCTKTGEGVFLHHVTLEKGLLRKGMRLTLAVDGGRRLATARNHSATHLLQKALRDVLGEHVSQAGSLVNAERLRFDFRHFKALTKEEMARVEAEVNAAILADYPQTTEVMDLESAKRSGATALFDEKYGDHVRVVSFGDFSRELCGGTHVAHSGQIGLMKLVAESSVAAGVRRLEALTGAAAYAYVREGEAILDQAASELGCGRQDISVRVGQLKDEGRELERRIHELEQKLNRAEADTLLKQAERHGGVRLLCAEVQADSGEALRDMADRLRDQLAPAVLVLGTKLGSKAVLLAMASPEAVQMGVHAGQIIKEAAAVVGGGGGGRPDMAQAGGRDASKLAEALTTARAKALDQIQEV